MAMTVEDFKPDPKKKNKVETLLIIDRTRAKGVDDDIARIYEPGEEIRIAGSAKLYLVAKNKATYDLEFDYDGYQEKKRRNNKSAKAEDSFNISPVTKPEDLKKSETKSRIKTPSKITAPKLAKMKMSDLDEFADINNIDGVKGLRTKPEKIAAIKTFLKSNSK